MPTKALTLSLFIVNRAAPSFSENWAAWRPFVPNVEALYKVVNTDGNWNGAESQVGVANPSATYADGTLYYGMLPFTPAIYPIDSTINRALFTPDDGWQDEFFTLRVTRGPYRGRSINPYPTDPSVVLLEYCVDVELDFPEFYLTRDYGFAENGAPLGQIYTYPAELINVELSWLGTGQQLSSSTSNRVGYLFHFRGGVQDFPVYSLLNEERDLVYYDGDNIPIPQYSTQPVKNYLDVTCEISGLKLKITDDTIGQDEAQNGEFYKVGWSIEPTVAEHGWPVNIGILENTNRYGYSVVNEPGDGLEVVLPHQYSHFCVKRTFFTTKGRIAIAGRLSFDRFPRFNFLVSTNAPALALPEQRTAVSVDGVFIEIGASMPIKYQYARSTTGFNGITPGTFDPTQTAIKIYSFKDPCNEGREDVSARVIEQTINIGSGPYRAARGHMLGNGLSLFPNINNATMATWWPSRFDAFPYQRRLNPDDLEYRTGLKKGAKWYPQEQINDSTPPIPKWANIPDDVFRVATRFAPAFRTSTCYEWSPPQPARVAFTEPPQSVSLKFLRTVGDVREPGYVGALESFTIAELDHLPFGHMPLLSAHEYQQHAPNTRLAGSTLWATNGIDGCWESNDIGTTWAPRTDWTPAFEEPFAPLDVAILPSGPLSWSALALLLPEGGNPIIYYRLTHDGGLNWEDAVEVGELSPTAWVWGCSLFSGHHHKQSYLLIANSDRLMWISHDTGATWTALEPPEEES